VQLDTQKSEERSRQFKRSIYAVSDIAKGEKFSKDNIKVIRPGDGAHPKYYEGILGNPSHQTFKIGSPIKLTNEE
jgi:sialic acid synthase SpsE